MILKSNKDIIPITCIMVLSALDFAAFFLLDIGYWIAIITLLLIYPKGLVGAWLHNFAHSRPFKSNKLHLVFEFFGGLHSGILPNCWMLHHNIGHHGNYMDQSKDTSNWEKDGKVMNRYWYALYNTILTYPRILKILDDKNKRIRITTKLYMIVTLLTVVTLFMYNPVNATFMFIIPMITTLYLVILATFDHHSGLYTDNIYESCRNNLHPLYNVLTGNLGYHTAHHIKQGLHWSKVPEYHDEIKHLIPEHLINRDKFFKYGK